MPTLALATTPLGGTRARPFPRTMSPLSRWTDDRLDDLARRVEEALMIRAEVIAMKVQIAGLVEALTTCTSEIRLIRKGQEEAEEHRLAREEQQRKERRADRRAAIATVLTVFGLVIATLALFIR